MRSTRSKVGSKSAVLQCVQINAGTLPVLLVEGKTDASLITTAWEKLKPNVPMPFEPVPCGTEPDPEKRVGGADLLRRCTEFLSIVSDTKQARRAKCRAA